MNVNVARRYSYVPKVAVAIGAIGLLAQVGHLAFASPKGLMDFGTYWAAGRDVLHGHNPYPPVTADALGDQRQFVYPAPAAVLFALFALAPLVVAEVVWFFASICAGFASFWLAGVRDARIYLLIPFSVWFMQGVYVGTVTPFLMLGIAAAWRWRDHAWKGALALSVVIALKLFPAPLVFWLWRSGRRRQAVIAAASAVSMTVGAWAAIGFAGFSDYRAMLDLLARLLSWAGFSATSVGQAAGLGFDLSQALAAAIALGTLAAAWRLGRRDERHAFMLCIVAALLASPIVWMNYFSLAMVGLATYRPKISWIWLAPLALVAIPHGQSEGHLWRHLLWSGLLATVTLACLTGFDVRVRSLVTLAAATHRRPSAPASSRTHA